MISATDCPSSLERGYRRLVRLYPRSFRRENEDEIIAVLLSSAFEGQHRPGLAESLDLLRGAARMHLGLSRSPRTVLYAVRLMYLGVLVEIGTLVIFLAMWPGIRAALLGSDSALRQYPDELSTVETIRTADIVVLSVAIGYWLLLAWGNGRGYKVARLGAVFGLLFNTLAVGTDLAEGAYRYAPAAMAATGLNWPIGLAAVILICWKQSWPYYARALASGLSKRPWFRSSVSSASIRGMASTPLN